MRHARAKLNSSSGASMVIALMFMLLCLMVGAVVLTAAAANAGRVSRERVQQQNYLTVSAAADLVRSELEGLTFTTGEQTVHDSGTGSTSAQYLSSTLSSADDLPVLVGDKAEEVFEAHPVYVIDDIGAMPGADSLTVSADGFDDVTALLSIDRDYNLTIAFSLAGSSSDSYRLTLTIPAVVDDSTATTVTSRDESYTVWEDVAGVPTEVTYTVTYSITTTTRTVTASWDEGVISKGG